MSICCVNVLFLLLYKQVTARAHAHTHTHTHTHKKKGKRKDEEEEEEGVSNSVQLNKPDVL